MDKKSSYIFSADVIRAVATLGVVSIHSVIAVYARPDFFNGLSWWFAIILDSLFRSSVPFFYSLEWIFDFI